MMEEGPTQEILVEQMAVAAEVVPEVSVELHQVRIVVVMVVLDLLFQLHSEIHQIHMGLLELLPNLIFLHLVTGTLQVVEEVPKVQPVQAPLAELVVWDIQLEADMVEDIMYVMQVLVQLDHLMVPSNPIKML
jgi:hypothetical protein